MTSNQTPYKKSKSVSSIAASRLATLKGKTRQTTDALLEKIASGQLVDDFVDDLQKFGLNEFNEQLRFDEPCFIEGLRFISDCRIAHKYLSGCSQRFKSCVSAQFNAWASQRAGIRTLWSFPKARQMELLTPKQHKPLLRNWAKVSGVHAFTKDMLTSNSQFDVGIASATFTHVNSGGGESAAGSSVVAVTADIVFAEEASQCANSEILPLYRRVDASRISTRPVNWLGTPGSGGGIENKIADCEYEFWPHVICPSCNKVASLHPLGALLRSKQERGEDGSLLERWAFDDGTPLNWFHHDAQDSINSAYVGCVHCEEEIPDEVRFNAFYQCVKTGHTFKHFQECIVPLVWQEKQLEVGMWVGALSRHRTGIAAEIMNEMSPESIEDWYQQRLGLPSSAMANSISKESLLAALSRPYFSAQGSDSRLKTESRLKTVRGIGIDQGRSHWYGVVVEWVYDPLLPPAAMYATAKRNILALESFPAFLTDEMLATWDVEIGFIDNEPSISSAAEVCRRTGLKLADQQAKQKDDFKRKIVQDGGEDFECFAIKHKKYAKYLFSLFASGNVAVNNEYIKYAGSNNKAAPGDVFKHLCRVSWDAEKGDLVRATDKVDDLYFSLMFAEAAFGVFCVDPGAISLLNFSWDWMNNF